MRFRLEGNSGARWTPSLQVEGCPDAIRVGEVEEVAEFSNTGSAGEIAYATALRHPVFIATLPRAEVQDLPIHRPRDTTNRGNVGAANRILFELPSRWNGRRLASRGILALSPGERTRPRE